jgi:hypothetical protein
MAGGLECLVEVALGDVRDFVPEHRGQLAFAFGRENQPGMDPDIAAGAGEGVDDRLVDDEEVKRLARRIAVFHQSPP